MNNVLNSLTQAKQRCVNPLNRHWKLYGARGIEFKLDGKRREAAKELGPKPEGFVLDRKNNDGHYELGNLRWASSVVSNNNRRMPPVGLSGKHGVGKRGNRWVAYSTKLLGQPRVILLTSYSLEKAIAARLEWEKCHQ